MHFRFQDRAEAGRMLAQKLENFAGNSEVVVLGLPRGGVPVAYEVARKLNVALDVFLVRKLGAPGNEELAMGAIASGRVCVLNSEVVASLGIAQREIDQTIAKERGNLERRELDYRSGSPVDLHGCSVILVDDGMATGASMRAAALAVRMHDVKEVVIAAPIAEAGLVEEFQRNGARTVCVFTASDFASVSEWYEDFTQTTDDEVRQLLAAAKSGFGGAHSFSKCA
ncbi:MAG TPA: phosphoribosyltransferase [Verrucomicrobiae bacterium]